VVSSMLTLIMPINSLFICCSFSAW
jgi:hypothetical protein